MQAKHIPLLNPPDKIGIGMKLQYYISNLRKIIFKKGELTKTKVSIGNLTLGYNPNENP